MESKVNVWEMLENAEDKKLAHLKVAAATESSVRTLLQKLSSVRQSATVTELKDGYLSYFEKPSDSDGAIKVRSDHSTGRAFIDRNTICAEDVEICVQVPVIQNTTNGLDKLLAKKLAEQEDLLHYAMVLKVHEAKGTAGKCLFGIRRPPAVLPVMDDLTEKWSMLSFELISMALPFKTNTNKEPK